MSATLCVMLLLWFFGARSECAVLGGLMYGPLIVNGYVDFRTSRLIISLTNFSIAIFAVASLYQAAVGQKEIAARSVVASVVISGTVWVVSTLSGGSLIGLGDARLMFPLAGWHAMSNLLDVMAWLWTACSLHVAMVVFLRLRGNRNRSHPFGPCLILGSLLCSLGNLLTQ